MTVSEAGVEEGGLIFCCLGQNLSVVSGVWSKLVSKEEEEKCHDGEVVEMELGCCALGGGGAV